MANNPEKLITLFEELADKLNIKLLQDKGDFTGGSCLVKDENFIVVNKRKPVEQRFFMEWWDFHLECKYFHE